MTQHNAAFNELVYASISETSRVSNTEIDFTSQHKGSEAEPITVMPGELGERDNSIFNLGVQAGAAGLLNSLDKAGYAINNPEGEKLAPAEGSTFSDDYFSRKYWADVSN